MLLLLVRHGQTALTARQLVGRTPGVGLNDAGRTQAATVAERLRELPLDAIYSSPLERALETAAPLAAGRGLEVQVEAGLIEVDYGEWTGRPFKELVRTDLWKRIQQRPGDARFPEGEALRETQARVVAAIERMFHQHPEGTVAAVSHGDPIRLAIAHLAGMHIDLMQRLAADTGSISAVRVGGDHAPVILRLNDAGELRPSPPAKARPRGGAGRR